MEMFNENMGMFLRLNRQKSSYRKLFSESREGKEGKEGKENRENKDTRRKLKRCSSAVSKN